MFNLVSLDLITPLSSIRGTLADSLCIPSFHSRRNSEERNPRISARESVDEETVIRNDDDDDDDDDDDNRLMPMLRRHGKFSRPLRAWTGAPCHP